MQGGVSPINAVQTKIRILLNNKGRYNFDRLKYVYYRNLDVSFEGFKSRQFNLYEEKNIRNWMTAYHFPAVQAGQIKIQSTFGDTARYSKLGI